MQYHLNGFRPGDPEIKPADVRPGRAGEVDVLIVGCGPAGLTLAAQLAAFPEIRTRVVERRPGPIDKGQADGISCRSMEMFSAFGFADKVRRQGYQVNETTFWSPDPEDPRGIARSGRVQDVEDGLSEMPHMILNQARVHDFYLEIMRNGPTRLEPDYGLQVDGLSIDRAAGDFPVEVSLRDVTGQGRDETVRARYVVGCDGARSAVRAAIGRELSGDSANQSWGVMDVLLTTDFPDIRLKSLIKSKEEGSVLIIPREGGYLTRIYIELDKLKAGERLDRDNVTVDRLIAAAGRIFRPYTLDVKEVAWWSVYEIGQRLTDRFDDLAGDSAADGLPHVFIAGDACHTHSPKAGQGMNVSMGDAFNLGWKLVSVLTGRAGPELLKTYSAERQAVAQDLIDFDREWAGIMSARPGAGTETPDFRDYFVEHGRYTAGMSVTYRPSALTGQPDFQHLAPGFAIGTRFHSAPVLRLADAMPMELGHVIEADARWRLFAFAPEGDTGAEDGALDGLCRFLADAPDGPLRRFTPGGADPDAVFDLRAVIQAHHHALDFGAMPALLKPAKGRYGLTDHEKIFCADPGAAPDIYDLRGIDRERGALVIVRPDQYVAHVLPLDAHRALAGFFDGFMRPAG
ncbi:MAG: FAD-binding monooxygenase [Pseudooceanicola sp.]